MIGIARPRSAGMFLLPVVSVLILVLIAPAPVFSSEVDDQKTEDISQLVDPDEGPNYLADFEAVVFTSQGRFVIEFLPDIAPLHVMSFIALAESGFFDGLTFHRYVEGFVVQGGDPLGVGVGGPGFGIPAEIYGSPLHVKGAVGMARTGDDINPERISSGSQFYICLDDVHRLDGKYTVWGMIRDGMDVVMKLRQGDEIQRVMIRKVRGDFESGIETKLAELKEIDLETELPYTELKAEIHTSKGDFSLAFFHDTAPLHVENFVKLAREGFYDGLTFHRYLEGFVIQGGDPEGTGRGGPGYTTPAEIDTAHSHLKGAVGMARTGDDTNPERKSSGSQFYICLKDTPHLDGQYTVWAQVIDGMDIVLSLRKGDVMEKIEIVPITADGDDGE